ncbi:hypothetical protein BU26DRAFT_51406 [Trematosphaeria pertusa]|uniref:Uncharacterized protein n=1 Tax=Trematosphaeria pertusa TaxID=390896 RepID=A0A6A6I822_9PLEO|nr:uncharacterized protein BU26DRAFT_51406 [Trematosphaeria pertusa]KAF2246695.1 hypothetical protein BU26DRAFT_51406 [Trematosphaeria pertusa]
MPSLHGAGVRMRLAAMPLSDVVTPNIELRKGGVATRQSDEAKRKLRESEFLDEERVQFPGDEENFGLNWLGDAPFFQVLVGDELRKAGEGEEESRRRSLTRSGRPASRANGGGKEDMPDAPSEDRRSSLRSTRAHPQSPPMTISPYQLQIPSTPDQSIQDAELGPKALVLHVMLTQKTFSESFVDRKPQHLMIDVFFNGQLSHCALIHQNDIRAGAKSMHQVFAGTRVDYLLERPWVIIPAGMNVDGSLRGTKRTIGAQERWQQICRELLKEADARGVDKNGERPPSAHFLKELSAMAMPERVKDMQKPGGRKFGVVDVVITVGAGKKVTNGTSYCLKPMRLVDARYSYEAVQDLENREDEVSNGQDEGARDEAPEKERMGLGDQGEQVDSEEGAIGLDEQEELPADQDAEGDSDPEYLPESPVELAPVQTGRRPSAPLLPPAPLPPAFQNPFTGGRIPSLPPPTSSAPSSSLAIQTDGRSLVEPGKGRSSEFAAFGNEHHGDLHRGMQARSARQPYPSAHAPPTAPRNSYSYPTTGSQFGVNQYGGYMANPYEMPYADMMVGLDPMSTPGLPKLDVPAAGPLRHESLSQLTLPPFSSPFSEPMHGGQSGSLSLPSSPFPIPSLPPNQSRRVSFGPANIASFNPDAPPMSTPPSFLMSTQGPFNLPGSAMGSPPLLSRSMGPVGPRPALGGPFMRPVKRPSAGAPPPIGFFAATTKPKSALPKDLGLIDPEQPRSSILLSYLTITGKGGVPVVDHRWEIPQRIPLKRKRSTSPTKARQRSPGSAECVEPSSDAPRRKKIARHLTTPPPTSPSKRVNPDLTMSVDKMKRDSVHDGVLVQAAPVPHSVGSALAHNPPVQGVENVVDSGAKTGRTTKRSAAAALPVKPGVGRPYTTSSGILGVQGPKANTFVFDDPEELLRKTSKSKSVSPTKASAVSDQPTESRTKDLEAKPVEQLVGSRPLDKGSSSPLSSVLSSLLDSPEMPTLGIPCSTEEIRILSLPPTSQPDPLPLNQPSPAATAPAPAPASAPATSASRPPPSSTTMPTTPVTRTSLRKRASVQTPRICAPRNPDRLRTTDNPPLNQDCVIAYAVTKGEKGVLRQVKGERQGVFSEESVVVACRFFVPG